MLRFQILNDKPMASSLTNEAPQVIFHALPWLELQHKRVVVVLGLVALDNDRVLGKNAFAGRNKQPTFAVAPSLVSPDAAQANGLKQLSGNNYWDLSNELRTIVD